MSCDNAKQFGPYFCLVCLLGLLGAHTTMVFIQTDVWHWGDDTVALNWFGFVGVVGSIVLPLTLFCESIVRSERFSGGWFFVVLLAGLWLVSIQTSLVITSHLKDGVHDQLNALVCLMVIFASTVGFGGTVWTVVKYTC